MGRIKYWNKKEIRYYSKRYGKLITVPENYPSDGATFASDIYSDSWWVHDLLCDRGTFDDGTPCTNIQASMILRDILLSEGRYIRAAYWSFFTFLFGGGRCRDNGMLKTPAK